MVRTASNMTPLGTVAPPFSLTDVRTGTTVTRDGARGPAGLLVMFLCNHCPYVKHVQGELARFAREVQPQGLGIVGISSNDDAAYPDDGPEKMAEEAKSAGYVFPYLFDATQAVAKAYEAACTPDFFLFDKDLRLVYRGQFDETRPKQDKLPTGRDLRAAVEAVLAGRAPADDQTPSLGCNIKWTPGNEPAWFPPVG